MKDNDAVIRVNRKEDGVYYTELFLPYHISRLKIRGGEMNFEDVKATINRYLDVWFGKLDN